MFLLKPTISIKYVYTLHEIMMIKSGYYTTYKQYITSLTK